MSELEPDLLLVDAVVHTMDDAGTSASVIAVRDGRILAVGGDEVAALRGPRTEIVELGGRTVLPGFVDGHVHAVAGGLARLRCDLSEVHSIEDYRRVITDYAARHDGPWIEGSGWYGDVFPGGFPTKDELDRLVPDRPAAFMSHDAHSVWVNTRALEAAGIDSRTTDPEGGRITRDARGEATGQLMEMAAELLAPVRPTLDDATLRQALREAQSYLHSRGVTAWQDALVGELFGIPDTFDLYRGASADGTLRSRVTGALWWSSALSSDEVGAMVDRRDRTSGLFRTTAAKIVLDGVCENLTAAVHDAYVGHPHEHGLPNFELEQLRETAAVLDAAGFDLHIHAVGDRAVSDALAALGDLPGGRDLRHQVAHIDLITWDDVRRMRSTGVMANVSPLWARLDPVLVETKLPLLTDDQQERHFLYGTLHRSGVPVAFGSDWPVSTPDPIAGLHTAVNRTAAPGDPHAADERAQREPLLPGERLPVDVALRAYTRESSRAARLDAHVGQIAEGLDADLVVLDRNPYAVAPAEIGTLRVEHTFVRGELVHGA